MNWRNLVVPAVAAAGLVMGYSASGWPGVAAVAGALVMWALLHFTRLMSVLGKASNNPIGHVGSAVMLNARLKQGVNLMHVMALTRSLGEQLSADGEQPERYRWTDTTQSHVTCEFRNGRLAQWTLVRPAPASEGIVSSEPGAGS